MHYYLLLFYCFIIFYSNTPPWWNNQNNMFISSTLEKFRSLVFLQHNMCFWLVTDSVRKSAHIEVDGVNFNSIFLSSIKSRKKWCLKETCRILSLIFGFHATFIHDWLSHFNSNVGTLNKFNSSRITFNPNSFFCHY